jgi:hypothetical protein
MAEKNSSRKMVGRRWPSCSAVNLDWDDSAGNLLGSGVTRHFPERTALRNRLAIVDRRPHALAGQHCDVSHGILVGVSIGGKVPKIWNARDKAAIALAIDHCPVPNSVHVPLLPAEDGNPMPARVKI